MRLLVAPVALGRCARQPERAAGSHDSQPTARNTARHGSGSPRPNRLRLGLDGRNRLPSRRASPRAGAGSSSTAARKRASRRDRAMRPPRRAPTCRHRRRSGDRSRSRRRRRRASRGRRAGEQPRDLRAQAVRQIGDADWMRFFETNVVSGVRFSRAYLAHMRARNWGRIVFISSESGLHIPAEMIHYGVTKTAQIALARGFAETLAGTGITVNSVLPGPTRSEGVGTFVRQMAEQQNVSEAEMENSSSAPPGRRRCCAGSSRPRRSRTSSSTCAARRRRRRPGRRCASTAASSARSRSAVAHMR